MWTMARKITHGPRGLKFPKLDMSVQHHGRGDSYQGQKRVAQLCQYLNKGGFNMPTEELFLGGRVPTHKVKVLLGRASLSEHREFQWLCGRHDLCFSLAELRPFWVVDALADCSNQ